MKVSFEHNGKDYTLEYTLRTASYAEADGFRISEMGDQPAKMIPLLFHWAFYKNHPKLSKKQTQDIYSDLKGKNKLIKVLSEMYTEAVNALVDDDEDEDEGNENWTTI